MASEYSNDMNGLFSFHKDVSRFMSVTLLYGALCVIFGTENLDSICVYYDDVNAAENLVWYGYLWMVTSVLCVFTTTEMWMCLPYCNPRGVEILRSLLVLPFLFSAVLTVIWPLVLLIDFFSIPCEIQLSMFFILLIFSAVGLNPIILGLGFGFGYTVSKCCDALDETFEDNEEMENRLAQMNV